MIDQADLIAQFAALTDCKDDIEIVVLYAPCNLPVSFGLNCSEIPNSCFPGYLPTIKNVAQMLADGGF